jgi:hypothetical protein
VREEAASGRIVGAAPRATVGSTGAAAPTGSLGAVLFAPDPMSLLGALATAGSAAAAVASEAARLVSEADPETASTAGAASGTRVVAAGSAAASAARGASDATRGGSKVKGST